MFPCACISENLWLNVFVFCDLQPAGAGVPDAGVPSTPDFGVMGWKHAPMLRILGWRCARFSRGGVEELLFVNVYRGCSSVAPSGGVFYQRLSAQISG